MSAVQERLHWTEYLPSADTLQHGLMMFTVAMAILSTIPAHRMAGSLGLRSVSLASASLNALSSPGDEHWCARIAKCVKIGSIVLGIAGLVTGTPAWLIAPVVTELALQTLFIIAAASKSDVDWNIAYAGISLIANLIGCIALATSSYGWMAVACAINLLCMVAASSIIFGRIMSGDLSDENFIHAAGYIILSVLSLINLFQVTGSWFDRCIRHTYRFSNDTSHEQFIYDPRGEFIKVLQPGERLYYTIDCSEYRDVDGRFTEEYLAWYRRYDWKLWNREWETVWTRQPLDAALYPTLPMTGPTVTTRDLR